MNVTIPAYKDPVCGNDAVIVAQVAPGEFVAFQGSDTRLCCSLAIFAGTFRDVCHGVTYDFCGEPVQSNNLPALQQLSACAADGGVEVWVP